MLRNIALTLLAVFAFAGVTQYASADNNDPEKLIIEVSEQVMAEVNAGRKQFKNNPEPLKAKLLALMEPHTDFDSFAKGVMGKYYDQATEAQRNQFKADFKSSLIDLYSKALVAFEVKAMGIHETTYRNPESANVVMKVTAPDDSTYHVQYSMRKDDLGKWMVRNVVLDGVNLGLTYRNQFNSAMESNNGDLQAVITGWTQNMEEQPHQQ